MKYETLEKDEEIVTELNRLKSMDHDLSLSLYKTQLVTIGEHMITHQLTSTEVCDIRVIIGNKIDKLEAELEAL